MGTEVTDIVDYFLRCAEEFEERADAATGERRLVGYAAVYDVDGSVIQSYAGDFVERIAAGAFSKSLKNDKDIFALRNHNTDFLLGSTRSGTLILTDEPKGLRAEIIVPKTPNGDETWELVRRKDMRNMSVRMTVNRHELKAPDKRDQAFKRTVLEAKLHEVSVVPLGVYTQTSISARSVGKAIEEQFGMMDRMAMQLALAEAASS